MDEELNTKIDNLINAIQMIASKCDELAERVDQLDSVLFDGLIGPANEQIAKDEYDAALSDFRCKFGEKLEPYDALSKAVEGDDFDIVKKAFDTYNDDESLTMSPSEYVDKVAERFAEQAKKMAEAANAVVTIKTETPEGEVEVKADEDGNVTVEGEAETKAETNADIEEKAEESKEDTEENEDSRSKWRKVAEELDDKLF